MKGTSYAAVLSRKNEIMKASLGLDFDDYVSSPVAFDYERSVTYPFLETRATKVFTVDLDNELSVPDWGPAR